MSTPKKDGGTKVPIHVNPADFSGRPNPVEPLAEPEKHLLHGAKQLGKSTKEDFLRLLLDDNTGNVSSERPTKRRRSNEPNSLDLPKLPAVKHGTQRLRIPPTLSGLHQPPPDAGLLPSMSIEQPVNMIGRSEASHAPKSRSKSTEPQPAPDSKDSTVAANKRSIAKSSRKHKKWSEQETGDLLKGVSRFGIGNWTKILNCPDFQFERRTALDLKDRFRVCCPDEYRQGRSIKRNESSTARTSGSAETASAASNLDRNKPSDRNSALQLEQLGIDAPFEKSKRRQRTEWSQAEDNALLLGFHTYGNSWAAIRNNDTVLKARTTTDLRDRLRTKYPDEYAKAGLAPRSENVPRAERTREKNEQQKYKDAPTESDQTKAPAPAQSNTNVKGKDEQPLAMLLKKAPPTSILHVDDVFWGAPFEPENAESEPITLDRGILDWAYDLHRPVINHDTATKVTSIDPLATLNLPRPTASTTTNGTGTGLTSLSQNPATASSVNPLPPLASITAVVDTDTLTEQLELPSLMEGFGSLESDSRTGGHFMSMEELLS